MANQNYFKLYTDGSNNLESVATPKSKPSSGLQWLTLFIGIVIQPFFSTYKATGTFNFAEAYSDWYFLVFAVIVAFIAFPGIYKTAFDSDKPNWIQLIPVFTAGLGWQTLVDAAIKGTAKAGDQAYLESANQIMEQLSVLI
ncbi:hypothetical protein [Psychroserpens sp.]|uniref:hypothetical protein n=1 Tax=Psychroserpens sp. TaxID=2020870 RepID=UPI001B21C639|nr:hypothetical protein [Psychroserpens sp.]MBO6606405.1 hypothetical protein [Psychroserpens sp.]MBO6632875.1 hypothetical protein [Psychroserpens sp.]MBO6653109.1 hypothetical protein [Psychroserpens sp.]MBO6680863.1 hypothetical protein [Psychroserpens sp.]MBO6750179.1 hypothetical protein [Psychroserpens sp.]